MKLTRKIHNLLYPKLGKILMLHQVSAESGIRSAELSHSTSLMISTSDLEELINTYRQKGWRFISMDEAAEILQNAHLSPFTSHLSPFICLTFDDGYLNTYSLAYPTLVKLNVPFCVYMTKDFYHRIAQPAWDANAQMMSEEQLVEMSNCPLCTIGVHTCTHPHLSTLTADEQRTEIADCKTDLEHLIGKEIRHLAYPHGDYNQTTVEIVSELGFTTAVTTSGRHVRSDSKLLELDRMFG